MKITYQEYQPAVNLSKYIYNYWFLETNTKNTAPVEFIVPPDGCISLVKLVNETIQLYHFELTAIGFKFEKSLLYPGTKIFGIRFYPGSFRCFYNILIEDILKNAIMLPFDDELSEVLKDKAINTTRLDQIMESRLQSSPDSEVLAVVNKILNDKGLIKMSDLLRNVSIGERQLQRKFKHNVGVSMKKFSRLIRIRESIIRIILYNENVTRSAYENGYYDQAHFINDLQKFATTSPQKMVDLLRQFHYGKLI